MKRPMPQNGTDWETLKDQMSSLAEGDMDWRNGRTGMYVFYAGEDVLKVAKEAYTMFMSENALGPLAFPSLKQMEDDVVGMGLSLLNAPESAVGNMTSGGSESIFLALKTARDWARDHKKFDGEPEVVLPQSAHLAFDRASHYLGLKTVRVPLGPDLKADAEAMGKAITSNTIMIVGSAPCYPFGLIDPIEELSQLALSHDVWLHVDACVGGYFAPFARMNGVEVPAFDFSAEGVRSMSADLHKYGYAAKGASTVLYRADELQRYQIFDCEDWPGGRMVTPTAAGTRPGGAIAAAWAVMNYLGVDGYREKAAAVVSTRQKLQEAVAGNNRLHVHGDPLLGLIAFGSHELKIFSVYKKMYERGWFTSVSTDPQGIHLMLTPAHEQVIDDYIADLRESVEDVAGNESQADEMKARYS